MRAPLISLAQGAHRLDPNEPTSPVYQAQRRGWNERYAVHAENARRWRYTAFGCIAIALVSVGGISWIGAQPKDVPFVIALDRLGDEVAVARADVAAPIDPRVLRAQLARWVWDVRTVATDAQAEKHFILEAYAMTNRHGAASGQLNDWFSEHNPFKRAIDELVGIEVASVLPISPKTWRVEWREETRTRGGTLETSKNYEATVTISITPPVSEAEILANPSGLFVDSFSWTARQ
jgi:type IV secretion system protein VirB5